MIGVVGAPELSFAVESAAPLKFATAPTLVFRLRVECGASAEVVAVALDVRLGVALRRRSYSPEARARLAELLGAPGSEGGTPHSLFWAQTSLTVPRFMGRTAVDLPIGCSYDLEMALVRYLDALDEGEVPLEFLFSGSVFYHGAGGALQVARLPWDREAQYRLPIAIWRAALEQHYPDSAWLRVRRDTLDRLNAYRARRLLPGWEAVFEELLQLAAGGAAEPGKEVSNRWSRSQ